MNAQLITIDDIKNYKEISNNTNVDKKIKTAINEAQEFDLRPVLGDELYLAIIAAAASLGIYAPLVNGCNYTYSGRAYQHDGLKAILVYYAYARIIPALEENATPFGMVQKTNEFSTPVSSKIIGAKIAQAISGAQVLQARTIDYLNRNQSTFPLWRGNIVETKTGGLRISAVGGRSKIGSSHRCGKCGRYSCNCNRLFGGHSIDQFT